MPEPSAAPETAVFESFDGYRLACRLVGEGRPVVLLHGLFSSAETNWLRFGHAQAIAAAGFRAILPDLRAHGRSAHPGAARPWPPGALARDVLALVDHLGLAPGGYDLGGYSLGARVTAAAILEGAQPRRAVLGGMGLKGMIDADARRAAFIAAIDNRDANDPASFAAYAIRFARSNAVDLDMARLLMADFTSFAPADLARLAVPTLVVCGREDQDNGSAADLAGALGDATFGEIAGDHVTAVTRPGLGAAIAAFLSA